MTRHLIASRLRSMAPQPSNSEAFISDTIRQLSLLPVPSPEQQQTIEDKKKLWQIGLQLDTLRRSSIASTVCLVAGYCGWHWGAYILLLLEKITVLYRDYSPNLLIFT